MPANAAALLLLADGRFPAGGYAHSGGLEATIGAGGVRDAETLESFLSGRAATSGAVAAAFAAAACDAFEHRNIPRLRMLDAALDARLPSPALRATSRQLGRQLLRAISVIRPQPHLDDFSSSFHQPIVLGAASAALGLGPRDAALAALHEAAAGPAAAAVRLLSLDPLRAHAVLARLGPLLDRLATEAARHADTDPEDLPAAGAPLLDLAAERHAVAKTRLFAS